ncbi:BACON domain-containing protein [Chondrinema litorale]|uniref:BACON domain-containing protein n=1 Tax=Chondrinema litorale TaxID=2994555 RepID=UPI00254399D9|nr:BACON domain-containing carbohydrate-binding protein [Chondrinema litorale]UZR92476.1 BACON domain-containing carbohydrate-binding protein [Chondrinema litorale]
MSVGFFNISRSYFLYISIIFFAQQLGGEGVAYAGNILSTSTNQVAFDHNSGGKDIQVSTEVNWNVTTPVSWISFSRINGTGNATVQIKVQINNSVDIRRGKVIVNTESESDTILIEQQGQPITLVASPSTFEIDKRSQSFEVQVVANTNWEIINVDNWINIDKVEKDLLGKINITVSSADQTERTGKVTLRASEKEFEIIIKQKQIVTASNEEVLESLSIYPVPASDYLYVEGEVDELVLVDVTGKILITQSNIINRQIKLNTEDFPLGIYFLRLKTPIGMGVRRILLNQTKGL